METCDNIGIILDYIKSKDNADDQKNKAKELLQIISKSVTKVQDRLGYPPSFYSGLCSIILNKIKNLENLSDDEKEMIDILMKCLRSSFYKSPDQQNLMLKDCYACESIFSSYEELVLLCNNDSRIKRLENTLIICITCFVNMIAGNSFARHKLWPHFSSKIRLFFSHSNVDVNHMHAALLHQFLLEKVIRKEILSIHSTLLIDLLTTYSKEGENSLFTLLCLKNILELPFNSTSWDSLNEVLAILLMDVVSSCLEKDSIPVESAQFFVNVLKKEIDKLLKNDQNYLDSQVVCRLVSLNCSLASSQKFRDIIQKDKSLLISTVYLIKALCLTQKNSDVKSTAPIDGFKRSLVRLVACLVYRHTENQDLMLDIDGLNLLLECSQMDDKNPLIKETCIFALRNVLEGNIKNQELLNSLQAKDVIPNEELAKMGLKAALHNGKVIVESSIRDT